MDCKNCGQILPEEAGYCSSCGAKVIWNRLTIRNLWDDFSSQFLNYDNKFLQTFIALFSDPADVIHGFINGTRKKYVNVLSYFAIAITYAGFYTFINQKFFPETFRELFSTANNDQVQVETSLEIYSFILEYQAFIFFLLVPALALMSRLVFLKNKKYNYSEHLVINLYSYSQASIIVTTLTFIAQTNIEVFKIVSFTSIIVQIGYFAYVLKKLFQLSLWKIFQKTLLFLLILILVYILFILLAVIYMVAFTDFEEKVKEVEKAKEAAAYIISSAMNWTS